MSGSQGREVYSRLSVTLYNEGFHDHATDIALIDDALRRAKADVWREAATVHRQADGNDCKYCLARAAQIEEGE